MTTGQEAGQCCDLIQLPHPHPSFKFKDHKAPDCLSFSPPVFNSHGKAGTRESPRPKAGSHGRDAPAPPLPPPPPPPPPLLRERSERAEAREHVREQQALASGRGSANGLPPRRAAEELRKQVLHDISVRGLSCDMLNITQNGKRRLGKCDRSTKGNTS